ncbi:hypothetical protein Tco_1179113, partial [Tanacetum coccineum]
ALEEASLKKDEINKDNILPKPSEENLRLEPRGDERKFCRKMLICIDGTGSLSAVSFAAQRSRSFSRQRMEKRFYMDSMASRKEMTLLKGNLINYHPISVSVPNGETRYGSDIVFVDTAGRMQVLFHLQFIDF